MQILLCSKNVKQLNRTFLERSFPGKLVNRLNDYVSHPWRRPGPWSLTFSASMLQVPNSNEGMAIEEDIQLETENSRCFVRTSNLYFQIQNLRGGGQFNPGERGRGSLRNSKFQFLQIRKIFIAPLKFEFLHGPPKKSQKNFKAP